LQPIQFNQWCRRALQPGVIDPTGRYRIRLPEDRVFRLTGAELIALAAQFVELAEAEARRDRVAMKRALERIRGDFMKARFDLESYGNHLILLCPACGGNYLHHRRIEVFERTEDAPTGLHLVVEAEKVVLDADLTANPSSRRHGLIIYFCCETCNAHPAITLAQHKGMTEVELTT
jgi:hypothetical protein